MKHEEVSPFLGKEKAGKFSATGIKFLGLRSRGPKKDLSTQAITLYKDGKFDAGTNRKITKATLAEWSPIFNREDRPLSDAEMLVIVLGRPPRTNKEGTLVQEASKIWDEGSEQERVASEIAAAVGMEHPYINKRRRLADDPGAAPTTADATPAKAAAGGK